MKKQILLALGIASSYMGYVAINKNQQAYAYPTGVNGYTGKTKSCNDCHATITNNLSNASNFTLVSDVPSTGYVPGSTYNFTLTILTKKSYLGFDIGAYNSANTLLKAGFSSISGGQILNDEIAHNSTNITPSNNRKIVTFKWTAPAKGTGTVSYYGSIATGISGKGTPPMDTLNKFVTTFKENVATDILDELKTTFNFSVYPTMVTDHIKVEYTLPQNESVAVKIMNTSGLVVKELPLTVKTLGFYTETISTSQLQSGTYFVQTLIGNHTISEKIIIK